MPAGDTYFVDEQPDEALFLDVVELVDDAADAASEIVDSAANLVVAGQRCALLGEVGSPGPQVLLSGRDLSSTPLKVGQLDNTRLVDVHEAAALSLGTLDLAVEPGELGGQYLVVRGRLIATLVRRRGAGWGGGAGF